jgi:tetratricopeptide (TPR) repeat protein
LGQIVQERAAAQSTATRDAERRALERRALDWYERALTLAPNEETYLLAAGQQALTLGDKAAARGYYLRALEAVPNSADARAGLQRAGS